MSDSAEFLVKTNNDVDEWMDSFYVDGRKAGFRLHCQWAWQEQERRHRAIEADLLEALIGVVKVADRETDEFIAARKAIAKALTPQS